MIQGPLAFDIWSPAASLVSVATAAQAMLACAFMKEETGSEEITSRTRERVGPALGGRLGRG